MKKIAFAGTFDPITTGHLWVIQEALNLADEVTVFVAENTAKHTWFDAVTRCSMIESICAELVLSSQQAIRVEVLRGEYVANAASERGIPYLIRGIRSANDVDYENVLQQTNTEILQGAKTLFVMPPRELAVVSSSFVKNFVGPVGWHWQIKRFLPKIAYDAMMVRWLEMQWQTLFDRYDAPCQAMFATVMACYQAPQRHYHTVTHLVHCLSELQRLHLPSATHRTMLAAIFFHDAIYQSEGGDDEIKSAALAKQMLAPYFSAEVLHEIAYLIQATSHLSVRETNSTLAQPLPQDLELLVDVMRSIDLAILGQSVDVYSDYCHQVRAEYASVSQADFNAGRRLVLEKFLAMACCGELYAAPAFAARYQRQAIQNLEDELSSLDK